MPSPLDLCQVLEEEYLNLHGKLSYPDPVTLRGERRAITARLDWNFHEGHIINVAALRRRLDGDDFLSKYLRERSSQFREELRKPVAPADDERYEQVDEELLIGAMNALLRVRDLYDEKKFGTPDEAARKLRSRFTVTDEPLTDDEQRHLNRLLLESWFPSDIECAHDIRLAALYTQLHRKQLEERDGPTALCLSGGGIRSGTFALGLMQGFARHDLLQDFDYLSTVSGGGYIGGWLTAWLNRDHGGMESVVEQMKNPTTHAKLDPEPEPLRHLRTYSNFLTPKVGLLTADTWTFAGVYLRNLVLNWVVLIPLLLAVLALPRLGVAVLRREPLVLPVELTNWLALSLNDAATRPLVELHTLARTHLKGTVLLIGFVLGVLAVFYASVNRPGVGSQLQERSPFWYRRRGQRSFLRWCLLPLVGAVFAHTVYWAWTLAEVGGVDSIGSIVFRVFHYEPTLPLAFTLTLPVALTLYAVLLHLCAWACYMLVLRRTPWTNVQEARWSEFLVVVVSGAAGGFLTWLAATLFSPTNDDPAGTWATELYASFAAPVLLLIFTLAGILFIAISSRIRWIDDDDREWWTRFGAWILIALLAWSVFSSLVIFGPLLFFRNLFYRAPELITGIGGVSGLIALVAGWSAKTPANDEQAATGGRLAILGSYLLPTLALLFLLVLLMSFSLLTDVLLQGLGTHPLVAEFAPFGDSLPLVPQPLNADVHMRVVHYAALWFVILFIAAASAVAWVAARMIDLNKFSLHGGYRNRLIRTFLGASHADNERKPNPFTGFDPTDNLRMHELRPVLFHERDFKDLCGLALRLRRGDDGTSRRLYERLSPDVRDELERLNESEPLGRPLRQNLIEDLNRILQDETVSFDELLTGERPLPAEVVRVPEQSPRVAPAAAFVASRRAAAKPSLKRRAAPPVAPNSYASILRKREVLAHAFPDEIKAKYPPSHRLLHVVNVALNLVGGKNLAWQQRRAASFTVSPLHCGCHRLGYRQAKDYGGPDGISLGTAATISGAAASSNMGYYTTSPLLSFVMTFFNVRLGWWLGNPGAAGNATYRHAHPRFSIGPVIAEAFGMTDDESQYVYLTDGGHFENLALYEMVLRRCHTIVVSDGGQDERYEFGDLGNAVRKIRIDLGIPIEFTKFPNYTDKQVAGFYWAVADIKYSCIDEPVKTCREDGICDYTDAPDGTLIYIKPATYGTEPRDVLQYAKSHKAFPHESTGDQFFDEPQFESYRALGSHIAEAIHQAVKRQARGERDLQNIHDYFAKL